MMHFSASPICGRSSCGHLRNLAVNVSRGLRWRRDRLRLNARCVFVIFLLVYIALPARADWINLTGAETARNIAEIYVEDDRVRIVLEVYIGDLEKFEDILPDSWVRHTGSVEEGNILLERAEEILKQRSDG